MPVPLDIVLRRLSGIAHLQDLIAAGYSRHQVAHLHRSGRLHRPRIGWYVAAWHSPDVVQAVRVGGALGCVSAARSFGCSTPPDPRLHVVLPTHAGRLRSVSNGFVNVPAPESGVVRHWAPEAPAERFRVGLTDALTQVMVCLEPEWAIAVIDSARRRDQNRPALLSSRDFDELETRAGRAQRRLLRLTSERSESVLESVVRVRLASAGYRLAEQVEVGRYRADLLVEEAVIIECDGFEHHGGREAFEYDRRRDAAFAAAGYPVLRLSYRRVLEDWPAILREVDSTVIRRAPPIRKFK